MNVELLLGTADGQIYRHLIHNAFLNQYADIIAQALTGANTTPEFTNVSVGYGGVTIDDFESTSGFSNSPVLDTTIFMQGTASFSRTVAASTAAAMQSPAKSLDLSTGFNDATDLIEINVRISDRAKLNLATEAFRLSTVNGTSYFSILWSDIETYYQSSLINNTWARVQIPKSAFAITGTPAWTTIISTTYTVTANSAGSVEAWFDHSLLVEAAPTPTPSDTSLKNEFAVTGLTQFSNPASQQASVSGYWGSVDFAGVVREVGLYGNNGNTLAAWAYVSPEAVKTTLLTLTVNWTVVVQGS